MNVQVSSGLQHNVFESPGLPGTLHRIRAIPLYRALDVSRSTFYAGLISGRYPKPDGHDGKMPFWHWTTVRHLFERT